MDEFLVECGSIELVFGKSFSQCFIAFAVATESSITNGFHRFLYSQRQTRANAVAALNAHVEPSFHHARLITIGAETGGMEQTEHQAELCIFVFFEHTAQVELDIGEFDKLTGVAQQSYGCSVADEAINILSGIEVFEHGGMRRLLAARALGAIVERTLVECVDAAIVSYIFTYDNKGHVGKVGTEMTNLKAFSSHFHTNRLFDKPIIQALKQTFHQVSGTSCAVRVVHARAFLIESPVVAQAAPHIINGSRRADVYRIVLLAIAREILVTLYAVQDII